MLRLDGYSDILQLLEEECKLKDETANNENNVEIINNKNNAEINSNKNDIEIASNKSNVELASNEKKVENTTHENSVKNISHKNNVENPKENISQLKESSNANKSKRKTLVLDLDETLIHTRYDRGTFNFKYTQNETEYPPDFVFNVSLFIVQIFLLLTLRCNLFIHLINLFNFEKVKNCLIFYFEKAKYINMVTMFKLVFVNVF